MNTAFFDDKPLAIYMKRQANLAAALTATPFMLVGIGSGDKCPMMSYIFLWKPQNPMHDFDHAAFARDCASLQSCLSDGMWCEFRSVDFTATNPMRDGIVVKVRVSPRPLDCPPSP